MYCYVLLFIPYSELKSAKQLQAHVQNFIKNSWTKQFYIFPNIFKSEVNIKTFFDADDVNIGVRMFPRNE